MEKLLAKHAGVTANKIDTRYGGKAECRDWAGKRQSDAESGYRGGDIERDEETEFLRKADNREAGDEVG